MRILQLVTKRQYRGAEVFAATLSEELIKLGHEIYFVGLYENRKNVLSVSDAINLDLIESKRWNFSLVLIYRLSRLIKEIKPDIIQCNGSDTLKYTITASYFVTNSPIIYRNISTISEWLNNSWTKKIYNSLFKRVDHVTSVGNESLNDLIRTFNYPREKTSVIRRGIPLVEIDKVKANYLLHEELRLSTRDKVVMHVGNFSPEKNHIFLLRVFSELKKTHPNVKLACVGTGITFKEVQDQINEMNLKDTVFLLGFRKDIPQLLAGSLCFVLCSFVEGVPGVIMEAAVQRIPTVSTNVGGVSEVLKNDETGILIDNFDEVAFKDSIVKMVEEDDYRNYLAANAFRQVKEKFNPEKNAKFIEDLYFKLIKEKENNLA